MNLLNNAKDSIIMGLEDYSSGENRRIVSSIRNLYAGILLLFKHKLSILSQDTKKESLIKQHVIPTQGEDGSLVWVGKGKNTVTVKQIQERLSSLGVEVDWKRVNKINKHRNNIEHYFSVETPDAMKSILANTFIIVRDFVVKHLGENPRVFLGDSAWDVLLAQAEVYEREKDECARTIVCADFVSGTVNLALLGYCCENCGSDLITLKSLTPKYYESEFYCRSCGTEYEYEEAIENAVGAFFETDNYLSAKDGCDPETICCPICFKETYLISEQLCLCCGESVQQECQRCHNSIPAFEIDGSNFCGYCNHLINKDD